MNVLAHCCQEKIHRVEGGKTRNDGNGNRNENRNRNGNGNKSVQHTHHERFSTSTPPLHNPALHVNGSTKCGSYYSNAKTMSSNVFHS